MTLPIRPAFLAGLVFLSALATGCVIPWDQPGTGGSVPPNFVLSTSSTPAGAGSVGGAGTYEAGSLVSVFASNHAGYRFSYWRGALSGGANPTQITMDANKSVVATFAPLWYSIVTTIAPPGGGVVAGPSSAAFLSSATLTATANPGYKFSSWSDAFGGTGNPATFLLDTPAAVHVTANFITWPWYTVAVSPSDPAMGSVSGGGNFPSGGTATLSATALPGYRFTAWSGDLTGSDNPATLLVDAPKSVTANFILGRLYTVTTGINLPGAGTVTGGGSYREGLTATVRATPSFGYRFDHWAGDLTSTNNPDTLVVNGNKTVTAYFSPLAFQVTTVANIPGAGTLTGEGSYYFGSIATLTATAAPGYAFSGWTGSYSTYRNPGSIPILGTMTMTGVFVRQSFPVSIAIEPPGAGSVSGGGERDYGSLATLTASANPGYQFSGWGGDLSGSTNPQSLLMDDPKRVTARFSIPDPRTLSVAASPAGAGSVGGGGLYPLGGTGLLSAVPVPGYEFSGWTGAASGSATPTAVTVTGDLSATAVFRPKNWRWTWMGGAENTASTPGVYGTVGIFNPANHPGNRTSAAMWSDASGDLWLFGGTGTDSTGTSGFLNDLWRFDGTAWAWMGGTKLANQTGSYGALGSPRGGNFPGARRGAGFQGDSKGNLYLFGGYGYDQTGALYELNDLWRFSDGKWTWLSGASTVSQLPVYGTLGVPDPANIPGARDNCGLGVDGQGTVWLFGGYGYAASAEGIRGNLNDLWKFDGRDWTWVKGSNLANQPPVFGTYGVPGAATTPGGRSGVTMFAEPSGTVWLHGATFGTYDSDLWRYDGTNWTYWGEDSFTVNYGTLGVPAPSNGTGRRIDWAFQQDALGAIIGIGGSLRGDVWRYDGGLWTWMGGSKTLFMLGQLGTLGVPDSANYPGGRNNPAGCMDPAGAQWIFGGTGRYYPDGTTSVTVYFNDLWRFAP